VADAFVVGANGTVNVNTGGTLKPGAGNNMTVENGGTVKFNGGGGTNTLTMFLGAGGTVDLNGQTIASGTWGNLIGNGAGATLKNSSTNLATISANNTLWLWTGGPNLTIDTGSGDIQIDSWITSAAMPSPTGIIKTGTNALVLTYTGNDFTGGVTVNGGTFKTVGNSAGNTIVVNSSGTLAMAGTDTWGGATTTNTPAITINAGGTMTSEGRFNSIRNLTLNGGTVNLNGGLVNAGAFALGGTVTAGGAVTSSITATTGADNYIRLGREGVVGEATTFDVTNAAGVLTVGVELANNFGASTAGLTKSGSGTLTLSGASANTYTGLTTINAGTLNLNKSANTAAIAGNVTLSASGATLLLSASGQVADASVVTLSGGTIRRGGNVSEVFGDLNLTTASYLDYGAGNDAGTIRFGNYTPSSLLTVQNFLPGNKLQFGNTISSTDLNNATLFSFSNGFTTGTESGFFTITAIPEPSTYAAAAALLALLLWPSRHRCSSVLAKGRACLPQKLGRMAAR
jgi:autotransporter-associated beta strand protein